MRAAHRLQHRMVACVGRLSSRALVVLDKCTCTSLARLAWVLMLRSEPMRWQPSWTDAGALRCLGLRSQVLSTGAPGFSPCRLVWIVVKQHIAGPTPHNGSPHGRRASGVLNVFPLVVVRYLEAGPPSPARVLDSPDTLARKSSSDRCHLLSLSPKSLNCRSFEVTVTALSVCNAVVSGWVVLKVLS